MINKLTKTVVSILTDITRLEDMISKHEIALNETHLVIEGSCVALRCEYRHSAFALAVQEIRHRRT